MEQEPNNKYPLIDNNSENRALLQQEDICYKYDYLVAVACGIIGGIVDIFLVGAPENSKLGN